MKKFRLTIRKKTILMIVSFSLILILVSMLICGNMIIDNNEAHFKEIATYLSDTIAATVDTDLFQAVKRLPSIASFLIFCAVFRGTTTQSHAFTYHT